MELLPSGFDVPALAACPLNCERNPFSLKLLLRQSGFFHSNRKRNKDSWSKPSCAVVWAVKQHEQIGMHLCGPGKMTLRGSITEFLPLMCNANPAGVSSLRSMEGTRLSIDGSFSSCLYLGEGRQSGRKRFFPVTTEASWVGTLRMVRVRSRQ